MELSKYIKDVLISKENVIVAGFGAFEKTFESAKIDPVTKEMHPPQITVIFRPDLKIDGGVLSKYVSEKENTSEENASELIKNQVIEWENQLQSGQELNLAALGILSKNTVGEYKFVSVINTSDFPESYGLPVIPIQDKSNMVTTPTKKVEEKKIEEKKVEQKKAEKKAPIQKKPVKSLNKTETNSSTGKKSNKKLIISLIIGIPVAALIVLGALNFNFVKQKFNSAWTYVSSLTKSNNEQVDTTSVVPDSLKIADSTSRNVETILENYTIVDAQTNSRLEPKLDELKDVKKVYLIAGSYKVKEHATKRRNILNKKGFNAELLPLNNGYYRVYVSSFDDIKSATTDFERIKSIDESLDVWILVNK